MRHDMISTGIIIIISTILAVTAAGPRFIRFTGGAVDRPSDLCDRDDSIPQIIKTREQILGQKRAL